MNLRVKSIEIVNFLNPLYNRYRSYVSSWKLMSNYAREGKERLKYWWKKKEKKKNHPGCTSFLFLLEFPFSTNNRLFIANLPRIGRMIHRLEPTAFKCVPVVGGTLEGRENERRRNLSSLSGDFCFMGQWFLTRMNSETLVIVLYSTREICLATLHLLPFQRWNGKDSIDGKFQSRNRAMTRVLSGRIDRRTVESDLPWWPWCSPVNHLATLTPLTVTRSISL